MLLDADSFDNYSTIVDRWDQDGQDCTIRLNTGAARTGIGCLQINSAATGPAKDFAHMTDLLCCIAWNSDRAGVCMRFMQTDNFGPNVNVIVNNDGSITFTNGNLSIFLGQTAPGLVVFNSYVSIAVRVTNFTAATGRIRCRVNGVQVFDQSGLNTAYDPAHPYCNRIQLMGPGGIPVCFIDDYYLLDCSTPPDDDFLGALKLYSEPPTADQSVSWTPTPGAPNFGNVNEVPPDGDTSFNASATVGQVDQYVYPLTGVPANSTIFFVQHELDMKVDSGSRSVGSVINGTPVEGAVALTNGYHIYCIPYDTNPSTGVQFAPADFPVNAGPKVTL